MYASNREEEEVLLIPNYGIPTAVRDNRKPYQRQLAVYFILASTLFERIAFFSLANNVNLFFAPNAPTSTWDPWQSSTALLLMFSGISYISTLIFAVISDAKLGRFGTIAIGFVFYLIGCALVTTVAFGNTPICHLKWNNGSSEIPMNNSQCAPWILGTFIFIAIGAGAVKSNLAVFGAEQLQQSIITSRYFDKYVVAANIGTMIATLITPLIQTNLNYQYFLPYIVTFSVLMAAALLFFIGYQYYIHANLNETVVSKCIPVVLNAFQSRNQYNINSRSVNQETTDPDSSTLLNASDSLTDEERAIRIEHRPSRFLDFAKAPVGKFHDRIVDDVKSLQGAFIVFSLLIPYWLVYNQTNTTFRYQGEHMNGTTPDIVSWMSLCDPVVIILGILVFNLFIYKCLDRRNWPLTIVKKLVIGMCFACVAMFTAGGIELWRLQSCNLSIYAQLPQNIFIGFSQLFAMVASYEYAYFAAPLSAQSLFMSLHFCSAGIASFIGTAYMNFLPSILVKLDFNCPSKYKWFTSEHFFFVGGLQLVFLLIFILCQKKFRIIKLNRQQASVSTNP